MELLHELRCRIRALDDARADFLERREGGDASGATHVLALVLGPATVGPHLRARARSQIAVANVGRLAAVVGAHGTLRVVDQLLSGGRGAPLLDWLFAAARGEDQEEQTPGRPPADASARRPGEGERGGGQGQRPADRRVVRPGDKVVFPEQQMTPVAVRRVARAEVFAKTINVGPVAIDVDVVANAQVEGHVSASIGAGTTTAANVDASGKGTAQLQVPTEVRGVLDIGGQLEAQGALFKVFPAAKLTARLDAQAQIAAKGEATVDVAVSQSEDGQLAFDARGLMGGALTGSLDLTAGLEVEAVGKRLWSAEWALAAQQWQSGAQISGTWQAQVSPAGMKADMAVDEGLLDTNALVDAAFAAANVTQHNGEDNPWKCRADGNDIVGDFKDFPWEGANGAPAYPTAAVDDHPANEFSQMVMGTSVPRPAGPYRIVPGKGTKGADIYTKLWRDELMRQKKDHREMLKATEPELTDLALEKAAKRRVEKDYNGMGWMELWLETWDYHHIQEINWSRVVGGKQ